MHAKQSEDSQESKQVWWRYPMMWLVVGGPVVVVIASMLTLTLALRYPDPVLDHPSQNIETESGKNPAPMMPAMKARNHAATSGQ